MDDSALYEVVPVAAPLAEKNMSWFGVWMAEAAWDEMLRDD